MKQCLACIVLLYAAQYQLAYADTRLDYTLLINKGALSKANQERLSYQVKNQKVRLSDSSSDQVSIYDQKKQTFMSQNTSDYKLSLINENILKKRISQFNSQRKERLAQVEKSLEQKLKQMSSKEQEVGASVINQLKYPDLYGAHTQLKVYPQNTQRSIEGIECKVYQLKIKDLLLKEYCFAAAKQLNISDQDYQTLRSLYQFDYKVQSSLLLAMGKTSFDIIDYSAHNIDGILLEETSFKDERPVKHMLLNKITLKAIDDDAFLFKKTKDGSDTNVVK